MSDDLTPQERRRDTALWRTQEFFDTFRDRFDGESFTDVENRFFEFATRAERYLETGNIRVESSTAAEAVTPPPATPAPPAPRPNYEGRAIRVGARWYITIPDVGAFYIISPSDAITKARLFIAEETKQKPGSFTVQVRFDGEA